MTRLPDRRTRSEPGARHRLQPLADAGRGVTRYLLTVPQVVLFAVAIASIALLSTGIGVLLVPPVLTAVHSVADRQRARAARLTGVPIPTPYPPPPPAGRGAAARLAYCQWLLADRATWRDLAFLLLDPFVAVLVLLPAALLFEGVYGFVISVFWSPLVHAGVDDWYMFVHVNSSHPDNRWIPLLLGAALIPLSLRIGPRLTAGHDRWTRSLLAPTRKAQLATRVARLTETRTDAVDAQAAELRRIERDLHDGAQARLVAMGMNLGAAEALLEADPAAARALLAETRQSSAKALTELRDLVRGIHPPVLADRGLGDAVRALALDSPLAVETTVDLPGRLAAPVESAAYFAVSELLTNVAKHARVARAWIDISYSDGTLRVTVTDDGLGGAAISGGTGLRGVERRIGTFDGVLTLSSPPGGPTAATMEIPCALSSPKTSSC